MIHFVSIHKENSNPFRISLKDPAVSPVVGIMLMLTVTLILAAIISGFAGGIAKTQPKPPQLLFEASMINDAVTPSNSFFDIRVISVSEGIQTRDLKLITEWRNQSNQVNRCAITPNSNNVGSNTYPKGYGTGILEGVEHSSDFGNYTLLAGTRMNVNGSVSGAMDAVLTSNWDLSTGGIKEGTPIRVQFVHVPSGAIIADKEISAEE
jgi:archaeal type IV pilus assembly protein PilA